MAPGGALCVADWNVVDWNRDAHRMRAWSANASMSPMPMPMNSV